MLLGVRCDGEGEGCSQQVAALQDTFGPSKSRGGKAGL